MKEAPDSAEEYSFEWPVFPKEETERDLRISEVAMREGADGFPSGDSTLLSMTENEIVGRIRRFYVSILEKISNEFVRLGEETANIKIFLERFDMKQMPIKLKGRVESELTNASVRMRNLALQEKTAHEDFKKFREEHDLTREPVYSANWRKYWGPGILLFMFGSEILLNGALVSTVVDGLVSGVSIAITVAIINVVLSFIIGKELFPKLNLRGGLVKWAASVGIILHVLTLIYVNLVFGIFRSIALSARNIRAWEDLETSQNIVNALRPWETLAAVNDIPSLFVIGVGIVFAIIALIDGYSFDDHYPGYGKVHRKLLQAVVPLEVEKKELSDRVLGIIEGYSSQMETKVAEYESKLTRWSTIQNVVRQQFSSYTAWVSQIEQDANKFLNDYRAANVRGRHSNYSTQNPPSYFETKWEFAAEERDPSKKFSHIAFLINDDRGTYENKNLQVQQEMVSTRDECVQSLRKFIQNLEEAVDQQQAYG